MYQVEKSLAEKREWLDRNLGALCNLPRTQDPPTTAQQILAEKQVRAPWLRSMGYVTNTVLSELYGVLKSVNVDVPLGGVGWSDISQDNSLVQCLR